jgi:predicted nucleotidyltransferase
VIDCIGIECFRGRGSRNRTDVLVGFPDTQGIYLFGSVLTGTPADDSDIDIAVLVPHRTARTVGSFVFSDTVQYLAASLKER